MQPKLKESWNGPWEVVEKTSEVDYRICLCSKRKLTKVVHVNVLKKFFEVSTLVNNTSMRKM